jgi:hypothetical protein
MKSTACLPRPSGAPKLARTKALSCGPAAKAAPAPVVVEVVEAAPAPLNTAEKAALKRVVDNEYSEGDMSQGTWAFVVTDDHGQEVLCELAARGLVDVFPCDRKRGELHDEISLTAAGREAYLALVDAPANDESDVHANFLAAVGC